jgi:hypothetical protein
MLAGRVRVVRRGPTLLGMFAGLVKEGRMGSKAENKFYEKKQRHGKR